MAGVDSTNSTLPTEPSLPPKSPHTDTTGLFRQPLTLNSAPSIPCSMQHHHHTIHHDLATPTSPPTMYSLTTGHLPPLHFQSSPPFTTNYLPSCRFASSTTSGSNNTSSGSGDNERSIVVDLTNDDVDEGNQDCIIDLTSPTTTQPSIITTATNRLPRSRTHTNSHCNLSNHGESNKYSTPDVSIVVLEDTPSPRKNRRKLKSKGLTKKSATFPYPIQDHEANKQPEKPTGDKSSIIKCPICFESPAQFEKNGSKLVSTVCGHLFCSQCIRNTITTMHRCPTCRKKLSLKQYHQIFL